MKLICPISHHEKKTTNKLCDNKPASKRCNKWRFLISNLWNIIALFLQFTHFVYLDDLHHLLSEAANINSDRKLDVPVVAPSSMCACDEMIHSATTTGPPLDVDCEPSRSESFDSEYDVSDSENDACASDSEYHVSDSENDECDSDSEYDVSDSENEVCDSSSECDVSDSDPDCDVSDFH